MADLSLRYLLYGEDKTASKSIKGVGAQASSTASLVSGSLSKMGNMLGGEVGDMLNRVSMGFDQVGDRGKGMAPKLIAGGTAVMGLGLAMQAMASKDVESMKQLDAAVEATGKGYDGFAGDVDKLIAKQVAFGHSDDQVTTALRVLTQAYGDPKKALQEMTLTTNLAAAKHIDLATAAGIVAKAHGGAGRVFKEFGITVATSASGTKDYDGALTALAGKLKGQASASMDSFGGKVREVKTWLENQASALGEKYGPAVTVAGGAVTALGSVMQVMAARAAAAALAQDATAVSATRMSRAMSLAGSAGKMLGGPLLVAAGALFMVAQQAQESSARVDELSQTLDAQTGAVTTNTRAWVAKNLLESGVLDSATKMGAAAADVTDAVLGNTDALARVTAAADAYASAGVMMADGSMTNVDEALKLTKAISGNNDELNRGVKQQKLLAEATAAGADTTSSATDAEKAFADAQAAVKDKTKTATDAINSYHQALQDAGLAVLSTRDASRNLKQAVVDVDEAVRKNGKGLSENTAKGRDNAAALDAQAGKALSLSKAIYDSTGSEDKMRASLVLSRASLVASGIKFGLTKVQAQKYADSVLKIPAKKVTAVALAGVAKAKADAAAIKAKLDLIPKNVGIQLKYYVTISGKAPVGGSVVPGLFPHRAAGGPVLAGMPYVVGDGGREEVFVPETNGTILPRVGVPGAVAGGGVVGGPAPSLVGLVLAGTLDLGGGLVGVMRGVVKSELADTGARARYAGRPS